MNSGSSTRGPRASGPRRNLRAQLRNQVRTTILDAAEDLIAVRGLHGAALAQIAERAGLAVGTLYNYFADRDAMIQALFETRRATLRPQIAAAVEAGEGLSFEPRLRRYTHDVLAAFESHRRFIKVAIEAEHLRRARFSTIHDLQHGVDQLVAAGVAEGVFSPERGELFGLLIVGALRALVHRRIGEGRPFADDADAMVDLLLDGARSRR
ncbi:MAG: TetR/AcrR family transcriptional regulator [Kofleriaceae bacterium]